MLTKYFQEAKLTMKYGFDIKNMGGCAEHDNEVRAFAAREAMHFSELSGKATHKAPIVKHAYANTNEEFKDMPCL